MIEPAPRFSLRRAKVSDLEMIYQLDQSLFPPLIAFSLESFYFALIDPTCDTIVAEQNRRVTGFIMLAGDRRKAGTIVTIDVATDCQNMGIGTALMNEAVASAKRKGFNAVYLQVAVSNETAIRFYNKYGFTPLRILKKYYLDKTDAWEMKLDLTA